MNDPAGPCPTGGTGAGAAWFGGDDGVADGAVLVADGDGAGFSVGFSVRGADWNGDTE